MPTKALLYAAEVRHLARAGATWGLRPGKVGFDFERVMARKDAQIADFAGYRRKQLSEGAFEFVRAQATFLDPERVALSDGRVLRGRHFMVATGSRVPAPSLAGLVETGYLTSDEALGLRRPPRSLVVLGGGAVALEMAQFFARFDTRVTVIQRSAHVLRGVDADAAAALEGALRREGIRVYTGTRLIEAKRSGRGKTVVFEHDGKRRRVEAEEILFALGRVPNTEGLGLERTGVKVEGGRIVTDAAMRTSVPHMYAAGDCTSPHEVVHLAVTQGEVAGHNIARPGEPRRMDYRLLVQVVFTEPQVAVVGLTGPEAERLAVEHIEANYPFNDHGKSLIMEARDGFVRLRAHRTTGEILGGCCVGPQAGELIHEIVAAMAKRMTVQELAVMPHYHPTLAEIWTYPAEELAERIRDGVTTENSR
jgi:pyruvate/2-oxoglutarate dehydrogenase complex dihydrolipoamide dehydrogenase (E3) component